MASHTDSIATRLSRRNEHPSQQGFADSLRILGAVLFMVAYGLIPCAAADAPVVKGDLGPCSADFTVTDSASKPLYDAKIRVTIVYGFMNKRKSDLEIGTDSDGKARIEGLPNKVKKILEFKILHGERTKSVMHDPANECHASLAVVLDAP